MSNAIFHNKWHSFNHYTLPLEGYPDSATDPIASKEYPFRGTFFNVISGDYGFTTTGLTITDFGSGFTTTPSVSLRTLNEGDVIFQPEFNIGVDVVTRKLSSFTIKYGGITKSYGSLVFTPKNGDVIRIRPEIFLEFSSISAISNSSGWEFYTSLTRNNSADWGKYFIVRDTTISLSSIWDLGFVGYTHLRATSGKYTSVYTQTSSLSPAGVYNFFGREPVDNFNLVGGTGWHIALSSATHRTNIGYQVDSRQKVAVPVRVFENNLRNIVWDLSAQTVYHNLTSSNSLTARGLINPKKGGKYTMWIYVDSCPVETTNFVFDKRDYNIQLKQLDGTTRFTNNILALTANFVTRVDCVYDGNKMLCKATRYRIFKATDDDLYFQGTGIRFVDPRSFANKSPVYVNPTKENVFGPGSPSDPIIGGGGINILSASNEFTETSSFYIPGTGLNFKFLNSDFRYFSYNLINAEWPSKTDLTFNKELTGSFDRVIGTLSAGDWTLPQFAINLIASPNENAVTDNILLSAYPTSAYGGPWELATSNIRSVVTCTSSYIIEIYSGRDRDISSMFINDIRVFPEPKFLSGMYQPFNYRNERTARIKFERIQQDYSIDVIYGPQAPLTVNGGVLWFNSMNDFTINRTATNTLTTWNNNTRYSNLPRVGENSAFVGFAASTSTAGRDNHWIHNFNWSSSLNELPFQKFLGKSTLQNATLSSTYASLTSIRLTPNLTNRRGAIFYNVPVYFTDSKGLPISWSCNFTFSIGGGITRGEGLSFIIQGVSKNTIGGIANGMGYSGIPNSLSISFDTLANGSYDPDDNHIELNINGDVTNPNGDLPINNNINGVDIELRGTNGVSDLRYCWIDYDASNSTMFVYLTSVNIKPFSPVLQYAGSIVDIIKNNDNPETVFKLESRNVSTAPALSTNRSLRGLVLSADKFLESNYDITPLSSNSSFFNSFTTFTVFETPQTFPLSSVIWWIGDYSYDRVTKGYGLILSGRQLYTIGNFNDRYTSFTNLLSTDSTYLSANKKYVVVTRFNAKNPSRQIIYVNNRTSQYINTFRGNTVTIPSSSYFLTVGKNPAENGGFSNVRLYEYYLYDRYLDLSEVRKISNFLITKYDDYKIG